MRGRLGQAGPWLLTMKVLGRAQARVDSSIAVIVDSTLRRLLNDVYSTLRRLGGSSFFFSKRVPSAGCYPHVVRIPMWRMFEV